MNWLLLRGLSREKRHWGVFPETLRETVPGAQVFCLDLPGTGDQVEHSSPATIEGLVEDVRGRWLELRVKNPGEWNLIGISLGGMIGMRWAEKHPEDFSRLVLINSSAANLSHPLQRLRPPAIAGALSALFNRDRVTRELLILQMTTRLQGERLPEIAARWSDFAREAPVAPGVPLRQITAALLFVAPKALRIPVLMVRSLGDRFTSPACSAALAQRFGAELVTHPTAGHDLPLDDPSWLASRIAEWYPRCNPSGV